MVRTSLRARPTARLLAAFLGALVLAALPARGQLPPSEDEVKAAYLYNFTRYVEWPPAALDRAADSLQVCVVGDDGFMPVVQRTIASKTVNSRRLVPRRAVTPMDVGRCHVVFIGPAAEEVLSDLVDAAQRLAILTVGTGDDFAHRGGMIQLVREGSKIRFRINLGAVERAGLNISSEVLKLATDVIR